MNENIQFQNYDPKSNNVTNKVIMPTKVPSGAKIVVKLMPSGASNGGVSQSILRSGAANPSLPSFTATSPATTPKIQFVKLCSSNDGNQTLVNNIPPTTSSSSSNSKSAIFIPLNNTGGPGPSNIVFRPVTTYSSGNVVTYRPLNNSSPATTGLPLSQSSINSPLYPQLQSNVRTYKDPNAFKSGYNSSFGSDNSRKSDYNKVSSLALMSDIAQKSKKSCNCTKSQCLKLYCECFAAGDFCSNCNCTNCFNNLENEQVRMKSVHMVLLRNPDAFKPKIGQVPESTNVGLNSKDLLSNSGISSFSSPSKASAIANQQLSSILNNSSHGVSHVSMLSRRAHKRGCNCKRSGCLKNYCECFEAKIGCTSACKCVGCRNGTNAFMLRNMKQIAASVVKNGNVGNDGIFRRPLSPVGGSGRGFVDPSTSSSSSDVMYTNNHQFDAMASHLLNQDSVNARDNETCYITTASSNKKILRGMKRKLRRKSSFETSETPSERSNLSFLSLAKSMASNSISGSNNCNSIGSSDLMTSSSLTPNSLTVSNNSSTSASSSLLSQYKPYSFLSEDILDATCQCLLARAQEARLEWRKQVEAEEEKAEANEMDCSPSNKKVSKLDNLWKGSIQTLVIEEFGKCLQQIVDTDVANVQALRNISK